MNNKTSSDKKLKKSSVSKSNLSPNKKRWYSTNLNLLTPSELESLRKAIERARKATEKAWGKVRTV
jgi:hypothetical protein